MEDQPTPSQLTKSTAANVGVFAMVCLAGAVLAAFYGIITIVSQISQDNPRLSIYVFYGAAAALALAIWSFFWSQLLHIRAGIERSNELFEFLVSTNPRYSSRIDAIKTPPADSSPAEGWSLKNWKT